MSRERRTGRHPAGSPARGANQYGPRRDRQWWDSGRPQLCNQFVRDRVGSQWSHPNARAAESPGGSCSLSRGESTSTTMTTPTTPPRSRLSHTTLSKGEDR